MSLVITTIWEGTRWIGPHHLSVLYHVDVDRLWPFDGLV